MANPNKLGLTRLQAQYSYRETSIQLRLSVPLPLSKLEEVI